MEPPPDFAKPALVLVEGKDDLALIRHLLPPHAVDKVDARSLDGKTDWNNKLRAVVRARGFGRVKSLLLIRDTDHNPQDAQRSIEGIIRGADLPVPRGDCEWAGSPNIRVAYSLIPGPNASGELEDLCLRAVENHPQMTCVEAVTACAAKLPMPPAKIAKLRLQVFIACQPGVFDTLAVALTAGVFPPTHAVFMPLRNLLDDMASS